MNDQKPNPSAGGPTGAPAAATSRKPRRVLRWIVISVVALIAVVVIAGPMIISATARKMIRASFAEQLAGPAELGDFSFSWPASVKVDNLVLRDPHGEKVVTVPQVVVDAGLFDAMRGAYTATVKIDRPEIVVRQNLDGTFNIAQLQKGGAPAPAPAGQPAPKPSTPAPPAAPAQKPAPTKLPVVKATVAVRDGKLTFIARDGRQSRFDSLNADLVVDGFDNPVKVSAKAADSAFGGVKFDAALVVGSAGMLDLDHLHGPLNYAIERLAFENLAAVAGAFASIAQLTGEANGQGHYDLTSMRSLSGKGQIDVSNFRAVGEATGQEPIALSSVKWTDDFSLDAAGSGAPKLSLRVADFLTLGVDGTVTELKSANGKFDARVTMNADLQKMSASLGGVMKLKKGYRLGGQATSDCTVKGALNADGLASALATVGLQLKQLTASDEQGRPLPIDPVMALQLSAQYDAGGMTKIEQCQLDAGSVQVKAGGGFDSAQRTVADSFLKVDADLDDLARKLKSFSDLDFSFGGKIKVDARYDGKGQQGRSTGQVVVSGFKLTNVGGKNLGPLDINVDHAATLDLSPGGTSKLEKFDLRSGVVDASASGTFADLGDAVRRRATVAFDLKANMSKAQRALGEMLQGYQLAGSDITLKGTADINGDATTTKGTLTAPDVRIGGPTLGPKGALLRDADVSWDAALASASNGLNLRDLTTRCRNLEINGKDSAEPARLTDLVMKVVAVKSGDDLELQTFDLKSNLANGGGVATIKNLMKPGMTADGNVTIRGDVAPLVDLARPFVAGLKSARSSGKWELVATAKSAGADLDLKPALRLQALSLDGYVVGDKPLSVQNADITLDAELAVNSAGGGRADVKKCALTAPGAQVGVTGTSSGFLGKDAAQTTALKLDARIEPNELTQRLSAFLMGYGLAGQTVTANLDLGASGNRSTIKGQVKAPALTVNMPPAAQGGPARVVSQKNAVIDLDLVADTTAGSEATDFKVCRFTSDTATAAVTGRTTGKEKMNADLKVTADAELANVVRDLGAALNLTGYEAAGHTVAAIDLKGADGKLKFGTQATIDGFRFVTPAASGRDRATITDPKITLASDADFNTESQSLVINSTKLTSKIIYGTLVGSILNTKTDPEFKALKGDFTYVPDLLGPVIKPWMSGTLTGKDERKVTFTLDGRMSGTDLVGSLRQALADGKVGLGQFTTSGFQTSGDNTLTVKDQRIKLDSKLAVNGGVLNATGDVDLRQQADATSKLSMDLSKASANTEMSPLLALVNPIFAVADTGAGGLIQGLIDLKLDVTYQGQITNETIKGGWDTFPKKGINGTGRVAVTDMVTKGTSLIGQMLSMLGVADVGNMKLDPVEFTITDGRLRYDKAVPMALGGQQTTWTGSIGLDQTLDLVWNVPVTDALIGKYSFLSFMKGSTLKVPLGGTATAPRLKAEEALASIAKEAAVKQLGGALGGKVPGLGGVLGGVLGGDNKQPSGGDQKPPAGGAQPPAGQPAGQQPGGQQPAPTQKPKSIEDEAKDALGGIFGGDDEKKAKELLDQGDKQYADGKKADAAKSYKKLADKYKKSKVYKENKARVQQRINEASPADSKPGS